MVRPYSSTLGQPSQAVFLPCMWGQHAIYLYLQMKTILHYNDLQFEKQFVAKQNMDSNDSDCPTRPFLTREFRLRCRKRNTIFKKIVWLCVFCCLVFCLLIHHVSLPKKYIYLDSIDSIDNDSWIERQRNGALIRFLREAARPIGRKAQQLIFVYCCCVLNESFALLLKAPDRNSRINHFDRYLNQSK